MSAYLIKVVRDGENWLGEVPGLTGAHTFARNLETLDRSMREVIVLAEDLPDDADDSLELEWQFCTGDAQLDRELETLRHERQQLSAERRRAQAATAGLVGQLSRAGFSVRDVAVLTGVSRARAQQLKDEAA